MWNNNYDINVVHVQYCYLYSYKKYNLVCHMHMSVMGIQIASCRHVLGSNLSLCAASICSSVISHNDRFHIPGYTYCIAAW